jgi:hypothetical protein
MISRIGPVPNIADSSGVCCPHDAHASRKPAILANANQITRAPLVAFQREPLQRATATMSLPHTRTPPECS